MEVAEDREDVGGWVKFHRRALSSPLFRALRPDQRWVAVGLIAMANWKDDQLLFAGRWYPVFRGEFAHALVTIADELDCGVKVVRTTIRDLLASDENCGGRGSFLTERWTSGKSGTGLRILNIVNYSEFQDVPAKAGTPRARLGHASGTPRAPREEDQETKEVLLGAEQKLSAPRMGTNPDPRHRPAVELLVSVFGKERGSKYGFSPRDAKAVTELLRLAGDGGPPEIARRFRAALRSQDKFRRADSIHELVQRWNAFAPHANGAGPRREVVGMNPDGTMIYAEGKA